MNLDEIDFRNPDLYLRGTPHQLFTRLRHENPVHWNAEKDGRGFWSIAKYDDITAISKNPRLFSSAREHGGHRMKISRKFASQIPKPRPSDRKSTRLNSSH